MSRVIVFDLDNRALSPEFTAEVDRAYFISGSRSVLSGGSTGFVINDALADSGLLEFGRMIMIQRTGLPNYAAVIDAPWKATSPVKVSVYNAEYLLSIRSPNTPLKMTGSFESIMNQLITQANLQEEMNVRVGNVDVASAQITREFDQTSYWDQMVKLAQDYGVQFTTRVEREQGKPLTVYIDCAYRLGIDTNFLFHDADNANMRIVDAQVKGPVWNSVMGIGSQVTQGSRLKSGPYVDAASRDSLRLRSIVKQFDKAKTQDALDAATMNYLVSSKAKRLSLTVEIEEKADAFNYVRLGNTALVHASKLHLPGGVRGWRGTMQMMSFEFKEKTNIISLTMEAQI
jgi:hypothetical protein